MGIVVKSPRNAADISWPAETELQRDHRRQSLCELDGILAQLEEINLRGTAVPGRVRVALSRYGIPAAAPFGAPDLIEAIFEVQERFMIHPEMAAPLPMTFGREVAELRRRIA